MAHLDYLNSSHTYLNYVHEPMHKNTWTMHKEDIKINQPATQERFQWKQEILHEYQNSTNLWMNATKILLLNIS